jgi:Cation transporter/ATPase, N-terminus
VQENATNPETGLTAAEAAERLRVEGPNELPASGRRGVGAMPTVS